MKRLLETKHLLYNADAKPEYVRQWVEKIYDAPKLPSFHEMCECDREFSLDSKPAIREIDLAGFKPTLWLSQSDGYVMVVEVVFAQKIQGKRKLERTKCFVGYNRDEQRYGVAIPTYSLTQGDKKVLDLLYNREKLEANFITSDYAKQVVESWE